MRVNVLTCTGFIVCLTVVCLRRDELSSSDVGFLIQTLFGLAWPSFIALFVHPCQRSLPGSLWIFGSWLLNVVTYKSNTNISLNIPANVFLGMSMGLATLSGNNPKNVFSHVFIAAYLLCLLVCIPVITSDNANISKIIECLQNCFIHYSIAMIITATISTYQSNQETIL